MRKRIFNLMQYEFNPITGEDLYFNEDIINAGLEHKQIDKWAYICHDSDVYTADDEEKAQKKAKSLKLTLKDGVSPESIEGMKQRIMYYSNIKAGSKKPKHWHVVIHCESAVDTRYVAKWFNVKENYVEVPKGKGAFLDCVEYLTHEKQSEKQLYNDELVKANFDFRSMLIKRQERKKRFNGRDIGDDKEIDYDVFYNGKTRKQVEKEDELYALENFEKLGKLRADYLSNRVEVPENRINIYITGQGGRGKNVLSKAIARVLFPEIEEDEDRFFEVGADNVVFEGYQSQPVIIWNDFRHGNILRTLKGRGNAFNVFDLHPTTQRQNVKFSSVRLTNKVNIVNSVQGRDAFLNGLAGEYVDKDKVRHPAEDPSQAYRRFPFVIELNEDKYYFFVNDGVWNDTENYFHYTCYTYKGNFGDVARAFGRNHLDPKPVLNSMVTDICEKIKGFFHRDDEKKETKEELLKRFESYGKMEKEGIGTDTVRFDDDEDIPF